LGAICPPHDFGILGEGNAFANGDWESILQSCSINALETMKTSVYLSRVIPVLLVVTAGNRGVRLFSII
jgi:hypothetical protein